MFGFPDSAGEWSRQDYLRLFTIIMVYIFLRPILQKLYEKLGERQRNREKKQIEDEQIRKHQQQRVREKLGIKGEDDEVEVAAPVAESLPVSKNDQRRQVRARRAEARSSFMPAAETKVADEFEMSDEDVSDLLG